LAPDPTAELTSRTHSNTEETFKFSVDSAERIYDGSLYGTAAEFRFVPQNNPTWYFTRTAWTNNPRKSFGFNIERTFSRDGKPFTTWVSVDYRIDYRYPGTDWVIGAANQTRESDPKSVYRVMNAEP
jgi:hypothetical protein